MKGKFDYIRKNSEPKIAWVRFHSAFQRRDNQNRLRRGSDCHPVILSVLGQFLQAGSYALLTIFNHLQMA